MDRNEIMKMPAGKEIDRLLAITMGWPKIDKARDYDARMGIQWSYPSDGVWKFEPGLARLWTPSKEIHDAWEAVEILHNRYGCDVSAELRRDIHANKTVGICRVQYGKVAYDNPDLLLYVLAETVPLAICRAVLLAEWGQPGSFPQL
jgi:hypothetical protein